MARRGRQGKARGMGGARRLGNGERSVSLECLPLLAARD